MHRISMRATRASSREAASPEPSTAPNTESVRAPSPATPHGTPTEADDVGIVLSCDSGDLATFAIADEPRPESAGSIAALHALGLATEILSGDSLSAVRRLAQRCGIDTFAARQSPTQKLEHVRRTDRSRGDFVAMVGDGINDAPVLAGAGVSIAMGRGSALALANADLILVNDSLLALPGAVQLARKAMRVVRQNLAWAAAYNLTAMPLAAMGWVPPWAAAIGMSASSILVVLNSLRLMRGANPRPRPPAARAPVLALTEASV
jgi:Cu2+-exporting ATPase